VVKPQFLLEFLEVALDSPAQLGRPDQLLKWCGCGKVSPNPKVRRGKALVHSGCKSRPGTGSFRPVAIEATVEATKPLEPSVKRVAKATR
jgi:hypothetical protein